MTIPEKKTKTKYRKQKLVDAKEISVDAAVAQVLLELDDIFTFKEQNSTEDLFRWKRGFRFTLDWLW